MKQIVPPSLALCALILAACGADRPSSDRAGILEIRQATAERIVATDPSLLFIKFWLTNETSDLSLRGIMTGSFTGAGSGATFTLDFPRCPSAWELGPGAKKEMRMRLDLRGEEAQLQIGCEWPVGSSGFDWASSLGRVAIRSGKGFPSDFAGPLRIEWHSLMSDSGTALSAADVAIIW